MKRQKKAFLYLAGILMLFSLPSLFSSGQSAPTTKPEEGKSFIIQEWLAAGPALMPLPTLLGQGSEFKVKNLLDLDSLDPVALWPEQGKGFSWQPDKELTWEARKTDDGVLKSSSQKRGSLPEVIFLSSYIESDRWRKANLEITSPYYVKAFFDGASVLTKPDESKGEAKEPTPSQAELTISSGKHRLLVIAVSAPQGSSEWTVKAALRTKQDGNLIFGLTPQRFITEDDLLNSPQLGSVNIAPDGSAVVYTISQRNPKTSKSESWLEIRRLPGGELEQTIRDSQGYKGIQWSPDSQWLSAIVPGEKGTSGLWLVERKTRLSRLLLDNIKGLSSASWSPTGKFLLYTITEEPKDPNPKVENLKGLDDRWTYMRSKSHLYTVMVDSGVCHRLTAGTQSASGLFSSVASPISPDGTKVLFLTAQPDYKHRPYLESTLWTLDLMTNEAKVTLSAPHSYSPVEWTADGKNIILVGAQNLGRTAPPKRIPNEYENDLYVLDPASGSLTPLTQNFDPAVSSAKALSDGSIILHVQDRTQAPLYQTDLKGSKFTKIDAGVDVVRAFDVSPDGRWIVFTGMSLLSPLRLYICDLKSMQTRLLLDPAQERFKNITLTKVEDFNFKNKRGVEIEGWLHYPANFDPAKKYPLIVHYYGGTAATAKDFGGFGGPNYHLDTANGYAVYILNPSGAPGWGPDFSDLHVNDWGKIVSEEIATGVKRLLEAKPFLDPRRVANYGGSYGGFMTMLLATQSDIFRTSIALYGISDITSYWGAGWWGFIYSGVATADSFPWNRPDIYVGQSPIFHADKIKNPLLLLHGLSDINVPSNESEQMFTALKILGREVSYIRFKDEDHGIMGTDENRRLVPQLMLAWWDKYLKDQPEAWEELSKKLENKD